jgi:HK97 gp10 family phage protein
MAGEVSVIVVSRLPLIAAAAVAKAEEHTRKAAFDIEAHAKANAPVDTGNLRNSINTTGSGLAYEVTSPAVYSVYQEYGTRKMAAHPFMTPAVELVRPAFLAAMRTLP